MARDKSVLVKNDSDKPVPKEILADAIVRVSDSLTKLRKSGLNEKAIIALVKDDTGESKETIKRVLFSLDYLKKTYCR